MEITKESVKYIFTRDELVQIARDQAVGQARMYAPPLIAEMDKSVKFTLYDAQRAVEEWGANCGPGALAAITGKTLDQIRPHLGDFDQKGYMNPTLMWAALKHIGLRWTRRVPCGDATGKQYGDVGTVEFPKHGLARIQWEGPWTEPGVPIRVRYRHSHWVAAVEDSDEYRMIFDINAMCVGGWVSLVEWSDQLVPWILSECQPNANGRWHITHSVEIIRR